MPAYEYECGTCRHHFERRQKMSDPPVAACPECGAEAKRLISGGAGAITKGGASSISDARPACGMSGGCCGQTGACCAGMGCDE